MKRFKQGIEDLRAIQLSQEEKDLLLLRILEHPLPSPYSKKHFIFILSRHTVRYAVACLILIVVAGGSMTFAAEHSEPGDPLYLIKVAIGEPIQDLLVKENLSAKAQWESKKAVRRIDEAAVLATHNQLTPQKIQKIEERFEKHVSAVSQALGELENANASTTVRQIEKELDTSLADHEKNLDNGASTSAPKNKKTQINSADTSKLKEKIKEVREQIRLESLPARSKNDGKKGKSDSNISDHDRPVRKEDNGMKQVQEKKTSNRESPDPSKQKKSKDNLKDAVEDDKRLGGS